MYKKIFLFILSFVIIFSPYVLMVEAGGLVPECNTKIEPITTETINGVTVTKGGGYSDPCDIHMVLKLVNTVIDFLLVKMATPLFALILIYVGWLYLSDMGSSENITKSKHILKNAIIGYIIALAAWLIVKTIITTFGFTGTSYLG